MKYQKKGNSNAGRKRLEIDYKLLEYLCEIQCTTSEIAGAFKISIDTLENRIKEQYKCNFSEFYKRYAEEGKKSLRRKMYETAINGNVTMMIWLSKQYLGMTEKIENSKTDEKLDNLINDLKSFK